MKTVLKVAAIMTFGLVAGAVVMIVLPILLLALLIHIIGGMASKIH